MPRWETVRIDRDSIDILSFELDILPTTASILISRGLESIPSAFRFMYPSISDFHSPCLMPDLDRGVGRIISAKERNERVLICGDYDTDGITSTALMRQTLEEAGIEVYTFLPDRRSDGYGFRSTAIEAAKRHDASLIITVDSGITAFDTVEEARREGIDVIVTDHHLPRESLPAAEAVINPRVPGSRYPCKDLAGVGVALKLAQELIFRGVTRVDEDDLLDFAAVGTVADVCPIRGENRIITKFGFQSLRKTNNLGFQELKKVCGVKTGQEINVGVIGFRMAPRINAVGRLERPDKALDLLCTKDRTQARMLSEELNRLNLSRQKLEEEILHKAFKQAESYVKNGDCFLVLEGEEWHEGVIGIVASRIVERYYRPTFILSRRDGKAKGSGRSVKGFKLLDSLDHCRSLFIEYGGHDAAAGLMIAQQNVVDFRKKMNEYCFRKMDRKSLVPSIYYDEELSLSDIDHHLMSEIERLAPFGLGNPTPVFRLNNLRVSSGPFRVGQKNEHLKFRVTDGNLTQEAIGFGLGHLTEAIRFDRPIDVVGALDINTWGGRPTIQILLKDVHPAGGEGPPVI